MVGTCLLAFLLTGCQTFLTTTYGGGLQRTGWFGNQPNLTPALVSSGTFGNMWSSNVTGQVYAQPVVHENTVVAVTENQRHLRSRRPATARELWHRQVGVPWNPDDVGCGDLTPNVGITGTPVIDPATDTAYFVNKTYASGISGPAAWWAHAVDVATGAERSGFPLRLQGTASNDPGMTFDPTMHLQRPGLLLMDGVIYAGFGGHCDRPNYQGWVIGFTTAGQVSTLWSDEAGQSGNPGAGIWQSGGGLVSDAPGEIVLTTGNGDIPSAASPGHTPPNELGQAIVRLKVQPDKSLRAVDFFMPYDADFLNTLGRRLRIRRTGRAPDRLLRHRRSTRGSGCRWASRAICTCSTRPTSVATARVPAVPTMFSSGWGRSVVSGRSRGSGRATGATST